MPQARLTRRAWALGGLSVALLAGCATAPSVGPAPPSAPVPAPSASAPAHRPPRLGLALGGGAARGFAHIGVLQVLEEAGLKPDLLAGTSAGSLVAALYAGGRSGVELQQIALAMDEATFADWTLPFFGRGVLRGEALARYVNTQLSGRSIEALNLPLGIFATDLNSGEGVLFRSGNTGQAVRASSAVPAVFQPVRIGSRDYVDGGLVAPVPVRQARQMGADVVLAVDISNPPESNPATDSLQVLLQTFAIMGKTINGYGLREADLVVRPALGGLKAADFATRGRAIEAGRAAMLAQLPALRERLAAWRP